MHCIESPTVCCDQAGFILEMQESLRILRNLLQNQHQQMKGEKAMSIIQMLKEHMFPRKSPRKLGIEGMF